MLSLMQIIWLTLFMAVPALSRPESDGLSSNLVSQAHTYSAVNANINANAYHSGTIHLQKLIKMLDSFSVDEPRGLKRVFLSSKEATCNDGSPAGFYLRRSHGSKRWIIFLEGGWYCHDRRSCQGRWMRLQHLMSSKQWPETRSVGGILSPHPEENIFWHNANHVFVPYCTSDAWTGSRRADADSRFSFMGSAVLQQVVRDLVPLGLANGTSLILAGSSAGGTGVIMNLDAIADLTSRRLRLHHLTVMGVADSGWFLDRDPFAHSPGSHTTAQAVRRGMALWHGRVPQRCANAHAAEPWRCYFGYRAYPTMRAPLFVFQWLFDEAQMTADNVGAPVTKQQWDYIHKMGDSLRNSFENVTSVFAPSCIAHAVLTKRDWQSVRVDELSIAQALRCWELAHGTGAGGKAARQLVRSASKGNATRPHARRRNKHKKRNRKERQGHGRRPKREVPHCPHRVIERCSWPQCNPSCPKLTNPLTGHEMDFIELLKSFGLNMSSVASALGIDLHTLHNMDHSELLHLLTQQSN